MKIKLIATGGTISGGIDHKTGKPKMLHAGDLLDLVKEIGESIEIEYEDFCTIPSSSMTLELELSLARRINQLYRIDPTLSGIVITHGTDSLEETAFLLWLLIDDPRPVVLTAAQRPPRYVDTDGPRNLLNSIRVAASEKAKGKGVLVCLNGEINSARYVRKTHTTALETFKSGQHGIIGYVDNEEILFSVKQLNRINIVTDKIDSKVHLIKLAVGMDPMFIEAVIETRPSALVIEAFGRGNIPPSIVEKLLKARKQGIIIVVVSRCEEGRVMINPKWKECGIIGGENLDGLKARIILSLLLTTTKDPERIQTYFDSLSGRRE